MLELFLCIKDEGITMTDDKNETGSIEAEKWLDLSYTADDGQKLSMPERFASLVEDTAERKNISQENIEAAPPAKSDDRLLGGSTVGRLAVTEVKL